MWQFVREKLNDPNKSVVIPVTQNGQRENSSSNIFIILLTFLLFKDSYFCKTKPNRKLRLKYIYRPEVIQQKLFRFSLVHSIQVSILQRLFEVGFVSIEHSFDFLNVMILMHKTHLDCFASEQECFLLLNLH